NLPLDRPYVALDRLGRVGGEAQDVAGISQHSTRPPGVKHRAGLADGVLDFLGRRQGLRVDTLHADKDPRTTSPRRLLDEPGNLVALGIDLNREAQREFLVLTQRYQAVEDRFPVPVPGQVVVGYEQSLDA